MELDKTPTNREEEESETPTLQQKEKERPPPIILTATINLLKFQVEIKAISKGNFEFRNA